MTQYYLTREDELYHYGIKGQKWGTRHWQNADGSFNEQGKIRYFGKKSSGIGSSMIRSTHGDKDISGKKYSESEDTKVKDQKMGIAPKQNKISSNVSDALSAVAIGALITTQIMRNNELDLTDKNDLVFLGTAFAASTLSAYGTRKLIDLYHDSKSDRFTNKAYPDYEKQNSDRMEKYPKEYNSDGVRIKSSKGSIADDIKAVNPKYNSNSNDGMNTNCVLCSTAYDLRRRGYDVTAPAAFGKASTDVKAWYKDAKQYDVKYDSVLGLDTNTNRKKAYNQLTEDLLKQGEGARGNVMGTYQVGGYNIGGHSIAYEVKNKQVHYIDCQIAKEYETPYNSLFQYFGANSLTYVRTDNCEPDFEAMKKAGVLMNRV